MKFSILFQSAVVVASVLLVSTAGAKEANIKIAEGQEAKLSKPSRVFLAITADGAKTATETPPTILALRAGLTERKIEMKDGFPQDDASRKDAITMMLAVYSDTGFELIVLDSATDERLAKVGVPDGGQVLDTATAQKVVSQIFDKFFGPKG
ncbi:MAG: hypothetical protein AAF585_25810 [Verrucomicrobiota bacterium]